MYKEINSNELNNLIKNSSINLIDIRDNYQYMNGTIGNAKNIYSSFLITNPENYLNKTEVYYIFCNQGITSRRICDYLARKGYSVVNIIGGYKDYIECFK